MQSKQQHEAKCPDCGKVCGNGGALGNHKLRCRMRQELRDENDKDTPEGYTEVEKVDLKQGDFFMERSSLSDEEKIRIRDIKKTLTALLSAPVQICNKLPNVSDAFELTLSRQSAETTAEFMLTAESEKGGNNKSETFLQVEKGVRFVESLMIALNPYEDVDEKVTVTKVSNDTVTISRSDGPSELNLAEYGLTWKAVRSDTKGGIDAPNMPSKGDLVLLGDEDEDSGFSSKSYKVVNVKRTTFDVQVGERRTVNVHVINDRWKPIESSPNSKGESSVNSSKLTLTDTPKLLAQPKETSLSNAAAVVDSAIAIVESLDFEMAKERVEYVRKRRIELDAKIDIHLSDEDANNIATQNDATARKEARQRFPSNEQAESIKKALAEYEFNLGAVEQSLQLLQQLVGSSSSTNKRARSN